MTVTKRADLVTGIILVVVAAYVYSEAAAMPELKRGLGPGGYPKFIALGLGVLGLALAIQSLLKRDDKGKPLFTIAPKAAGRAFVFFILSLAYIQAIPYIGFIIASIVFLLIAIPFFGYRKPITSVLFSVLLVLGLYATFRYLFLVLIPTGSLFG